MLVKETTMKTLILYIAENNISKGCARAQLNNLFAVSC